MVNSGKPEPVRVLEADPTLELSVITEKRHAGMYRAATRVVTVDDIGDVFAVRRAALEMTPDEGNFHVVMAPSERAVSAAGYLQSFLGLPGMSFDTANRCTNKFAMKTALTSAGVPVADFELAPRRRDVSAAAERLGWPVVVKPVLGGGAMNTAVLTEQDHATPSTELLDSAEIPLIVERKVDIDAEFHCDGVVEDGLVHCAVVSEYAHPILDNMDGIMGSFVLPEDSPDVAVVQDLHRRCVEVLGIRSGVTHMEVLKSTAGYTVGEIACRPAGAGIPEMIEMQVGVDLWDAFVALSLQRELKVAPDRRKGLFMQVLLPSRAAGTVEHVTPARDLEAIPGVVRVDLDIEVGSRVDAVRIATACVGKVWAWGEDIPSMRKVLNDIATTYEMRVKSGCA